MNPGEIEVYPYAAHDASQMRLYSTLLETDYFQDFKERQAPNFNDLSLEVCYLRSFRNDGNPNLAVCTMRGTLNSGVKYGYSVMVTPDSAGMYVGIRVKPPTGLAGIFQKAAIRPLRALLGRPQDDVYWLMVNQYRPTGWTTEPATGYISKDNNALMAAIRETEEETGVALGKYLTDDMPIVAVGQIRPIPGMPVVLDLFRVIIDLPRHEFEKLRDGLTAQTHEDEHTRPELLTLPQILDRAIEQNNGYTLQLFTKLGNSINPKAMKKAFKAVSAAIANDNPRKTLEALKRRPQG